MKVRVRERGETGVQTLGARCRGGADGQRDANKTKESRVGIQWRVNDLIFDFMAGGILI